MDENILEKLEELHNLSEKNKNDIRVKYSDWLNEIMGRTTSSPDKFNDVFVPLTYSKCKTIRALVSDLLYALYEGARPYSESRDMIEHLISEVVFMTMFFEEQIKQMDNSKEQLS